MILYGSDIGIWGKNMVNATDYIENLAAAGQYHFSTAEAQTALGGSANAVRQALGRLIDKGLLASPARGFYIIVPPEYRRLHCLPAEQFIPALMKQQNRLYYAALLSAAQYYGAAHHRPQLFQVAVEKNRHSIKCGIVLVSFIARKHIADIPVREFNTPRGTLRVSTPEATALDLVGYAEHAGGLDNVVTVLSELADQIDPVLLADVARQTAPLVWGQRLGYLLDYVGAGEKTFTLKDHIAREARDFTPLIPGEDSDQAPRDKDWKVLVNADIEAEI